MLSNHNGSCVDPTQERNSQIINGHPIDLKLGVKSTRMDIDEFTDTPSPYLSFKFGFNGDNAAELYE